MRYILIHDVDHLAPEGYSWGEHPEQDLAIGKQAFIDRGISVDGVELFETSIFSRDRDELVVAFTTEAPLSIDLSSDEFIEECLDEGVYRSDTTLFIGEVNHYLICNGAESVGKQLGTDVQIWSEFEEEFDDECSEHNCFGMILDLSKLRLEA